MKDRLQFIQALFDDGDQVAFGADDRTAYKAVNPLPFFLNTNANKFCINPITKKRIGENVTHVNSILIECDDKSLSREEQFKRFNESGLPYTTMMWSGTKSIHCIIRLNDPIYHEDFDMKKQLYKNWHRAIREVMLKFGITADDSTDKLPQLSRVPGSIRNETGTLQELITINRRVDQAEVIEWLDKNNVTIKQPVKIEPIKYVMGTNDRVSGLEKFRKATNWTQKKHGQYSTYMTTGAYMWLWHLGVNGYKVDIDESTLISLAQLEWGYQYTGGNGVGMVDVTINKGYQFAYKQNMEKVNL